MPITLFSKKKWYVLLRPLYMRYKALRFIRQSYQNIDFESLSKLKFWTNASKNLMAIQSLSEQRFSYDYLAKSPRDAADFAWPVIDITAVSFNSERWINNFFDSLISQSYPTSKINLFIVDHGSSDNTVVLINQSMVRYRNQFSSINLFHQENVGFGGGHEKAIENGNASLILVTNLDVEFLSETIVEVVSAALRDSQGQVASWELRQIPFEHPKYYDPVTLDTNWSSHACVLIRRSAYKYVGGYDQHIFMYTEDVELSYRFRSYGYQLKYIPRAVIKHRTYEVAGQIKPLQHVGSAVGNIYIRLRYGNLIAKINAFLLYALRFFMRSRFYGAKKLLMQSLMRIPSQSRHFMLGKGPAKAYFPLYVFDYELLRDGAFYEIQEFPVNFPSPLVSIIMRTYEGRSAYLVQAIQSVFNQTYGRIELLVIEDGGNSQESLVKSLPAPHGCHLRYIPSPKLGRSAAGNVGLLNAEGKYLMFLDDDDLLFSDHVEILVHTLIKDQNLSAAYSLAFEVRTVNKKDSKYLEVNFSMPAIFYQNWDYEILCDHNFIPIQSILFKKELYLKHGGFDVNLEQLEDWNLWLRYGYQSTFKFVPKTTSLFRSPANFSQRNARHNLLHGSYALSKSNAFMALEKQGNPRC